MGVFGTRVSWDSHPLFETFVPSTAETSAVPCFQVDKRLTGRPEPLLHAEARPPIGARVQRTLRRPTAEHKKSCRQDRRAQRRTKRASRFRKLVWRGTTLAGREAARCEREVRAIVVPPRMSVVSAFLRCMSSLVRAGGCRTRCWSGCFTPTARRGSLALHGSSL